MGRELEFYQQAERSIVKKYRRELWTPFITAVQRYELVQRGDRIAVCVSGDFDPKEMVAAIKKYFGDWKPNPEIPALQFEPEALRELAREAITRKTGARGLRAAMEKIMTDVMFDASQKKVVVTVEMVREGLK